MQNYIQLLWQEISPTQENVFNGAVEALLTLLGAGGAFVAGFINNKKFERWDMWILAGCSAINGGILLWGALTEIVWISYGSYVVFGVLYHFMITVAR